MPQFHSTTKCHSATKCRSATKCYNATEWHSATKCHNVTAPQNPAVPQNATVLQNATVPQIGTMPQNATVVNRVHRVWAKFIRGVGRVHSGWADVENPSEIPMDQIMFTPTPQKCFACLFNHYGKFSELPNQQITYIFLLFFRIFGTFYNHSLIRMSFINLHICPTSVHWLESVE